MRKNVLILGHNDATQFIDIYNQYTRLFDEQQYDVTVAYLTGTPSDDTKQRTLTPNVLFLNQSKKSIRALKIGPIRKLLALCREKRFEIVICHRYKPSYIMMWVAQFIKIPALIYVMHELGTISSLNRQLLIAALGRKNMLFAGVSNAVRDDMRKDLWSVPKDRVTTLYNMIDIDLTEPQFLSREEARAQLNLPNDAFVFGNIARLVRNKDQESLINAFSIVKSSCPNAKLIILGKGELEPKLKTQVASLNLTEDVLFTGFVPNGFRYMKAFDCFVLSSTQEAFGRVLLEAMIAKIPIIATAVNGIPEVVDSVGTLITPKNPAEFAIAMQHIYKTSQEKRDELSEKAYQHAQTNFSIPAFQQEFWQLPLIKKTLRTIEE